ncbi:MAG: hypothetical protein A2941_03085 [Candidatus Yanofskybacteria bacterium RIFCSPLOWO2_01_FULL_49_17]|uniref:HIT domain-containing protein n=1 Tax=Candidatus Yanofskybacteria bacterium RIFCSPLOWO2_01_FULL_49_17 TaxID=1802700 RepID=A0A1F8GRD9_9BACT|nr:MAG: hypothetical protein A2941_03085 [Candidatus Yanofskybacteria bacterium RIFCSPLOWO2_01_FULL_49_17]
MIDDVFCKIIKGELKSEIVLENEEFIVIKDIKPNAPVHLLIIPKQHYFGLHDAPPELVGRAFEFTKKTAEHVGVADNGYRLVLNEGKHAGKLVPHLHIHLLAGKDLGAKLIK